MIIVHGSSLPWRDLICILGTIALNAAIDVSTQWDRKARSGPGVQGSRFTVEELVKSRKVPFFVIPAKAGHVVKL